MGKIIVIVIVAFLLIGQMALAGTVTLQWDSSTGATGYKVYYGTDNPPTNGIGATEGSSPVDVGLKTVAVLHNIGTSADEHFAITAYSASGESSDSNIVTITSGQWTAYGTFSAFIGSTPYNTSGRMLNLLMY